MISKLGSVPNSASSGLGGGRDFTIAHAKKIVRKVKLFKKYWMENRTLQKSISKSLGVPFLTPWTHGIYYRINFKVTDEGLKKRDQKVLDACFHSDSAIVTVIGGGYDKDDLKLAHRHAIIEKEAYQFSINNSLNFNYGKL